MRGNAEDHHRETYGNTLVDDEAGTAAVSGLPAPAAVVQGHAGVAPPPPPDAAGRAVAGGAGVGVVGVAWGAGLWGLGQ